MARASGRPKKEEKKITPTIKKNGERNTVGYTNKLMLIYVTS